MAEGLLIYLTEDENERLLATITSASAPGSKLALTLGGPGTLDVPSLDEPTGDQPLGSYGSVNAMWKSEAPADPAAWLARHGWVAEVFSARERAAAYGRPLPKNAPASATRSLVTATRAG
jgi:O-methyltransferase involved in polyketide biosynthesis